MSLDVQKSSEPIAIRYDPRFDFHGSYAEEKSARRRDNPRFDYVCRAGRWTVLIGENKNRNGVRRPI
jgi:hypothetical protein